MAITVALQVQYCLRTLTFQAGSYWGARLPKATVSCAVLPPTVADASFRSSAETCHHNRVLCRPNYDNTCINTLMSMLCRVCCEAGKQRHKAISALKPWDYICMVLAGCAAETRMTGKQMICHVQLERQHVHAKPNRNLYALQTHFANSMFALAHIVLSADFVFSKCT